MSGRFTISLDTFMPLQGRMSNMTITNALTRLFGDTFAIPDRLQQCAKMEVWAGGDVMSYPPLPVIEGVGQVPYHTACDFTARSPKLWSPNDLRRFLKVRHYNVSNMLCQNGFVRVISYLTDLRVCSQVTRHHQMLPSLHPKTLEPLRGLVELVESHIAMSQGHQPQPLSNTEAEDYGHVDPVRWTPTDDRVLTLKNDIAEILRIVKSLKITDQSIVDR